MTASQCCPVSGYSISTDAKPPPELTLAVFSCHIGLLDRYRIEVVPAHESENTPKSKNTSLNRLRAALGHNLVTMIKPQTVYKYRDLVGRTKSKKQAILDLEV